MMLSKKATVTDAMQAIVQCGRAGAETQQIANLIIAAHKAFNLKVYRGKTDGTSEHEFESMLDTAEDVLLLCIPVAEKFLAGGSEAELVPSLREILHTLQQAATASNED